MAKCVVCTHENAREEMKRHNNSVTGSTVHALLRRRKQFSAKNNPNKFCKLHGGSKCTGRAMTAEANKFEEVHYAAI